MFTYAHIFEFVSVINVSRSNFCKYLLPRPLAPLSRDHINTKDLIPKHHQLGARGGAVGRGTALQAGKSRVRFPMDVTGLFRVRKLSDRPMALGSTQPLTEMRIRNIYWLNNGDLHVPSVLKSGNLKLLQPIRDSHRLCRD